MNRPDYTIERWPLGWLICAAIGKTGIPIGALNECLGLFPKDAVMQMAIPHHFNASGHEPHVVVCVATVQDGQEWEKQIEDSLAEADPQDRWWRGTDVGLSSAALFAVLADKNWQWCADYMGHGATPVDAADFGRCHRLIGRFPEWRNRMDEVAVKYADTKWPAILQRWDEIAAAEPMVQSRILREIHDMKP